MYISVYCDGAVSIPIEKVFLIYVSLFCTHRVVPVVMGFRIEMHGGSCSNKLKRQFIFLLKISFHVRESLQRHASLCARF